jgi:ATP-dependent RNA helicase HelY
VSILDYRQEFIDGLGFGLDRFQLDAIEAVDKRVNVLVSAPTGSGKTLVANYAIGRELEREQRTFYTTPLKALSNQKYHELCALYGEGRVGLLTGDTSINRTAAVVVMTTEVLRNMLLTESDQLTSLGLVILDEVHYLARSLSRGSVGGSPHPHACHRCVSSRSRPPLATPTSSESG